jgi:glycosyltransferase involved in cell wall biosynthesis
LQDLFPEVAAALGVKFVSGVPYNILKSMRNKTLNQAKINIVIGELMAERLQKEGIAKEKIVVIPNWADGEKIKPIPHEENPLRKQWGLEGKYVVGYSGNLGRSHDFSTILAAAELLRNESEIVFLIIGDGAQLVKIKQECKEKKLDNVKFKPYQPRDDLQCSLSVSDIHLISLKPELEGMIVPSKFYGILAAGRPVIFIGDRNGELSCMIRDYQCGFVVSADNYHQLYDVVVMQCKVTKSKGNNQRIRKVYEDLYEKIISIDRFRRILS